MTALNDDDMDLTTRAAQWVAAGIIDQRWVAGQRLNEVRLAQEMGISRAPVREALRALSEQGMVTYKARVGCVVNAFTPKTVLDLYALRAAMEQWCVTVSMPHMTADDIQTLERYLVPMEVAWVSQNYSTFYTHAWAMRDVIYGRCNNSVAIEEIRKLRERLHQLPLVLHKIPEHSDWTLQKHREMVAVVKEGNASKVADIVGEILAVAGQYVSEAYEARFNSLSAEETGSAPRAPLLTPSPSGL